MRRPPITLPAATLGAYRNGTLGPIKLSEKLVICLTLEQLEGLRRQANLTGTSPGGFLRNLLVEHLQAEK